MKLKINERLKYGNEVFKPENGPFSVPQQIPKSVAESVVEKGKGNFIEDSEEGEEEVEEKEISFPDEKAEETTVEVEESGPPLDPGVYQGRISGLAKRKVSVSDGSADYLDLIIEAVNQEGEKVELTAGYPLKVTRRTMLGKLLVRFGQSIEAGEKLTLDTILTGTDIRFQVKENEEGYADVIRSTVRPA